MIHADKDLARRHERAAMAIESEYARCHAAIRPGFEIAIEPIADGVAIFAGVNSPMSQATGLGLDGPVTDEHLQALETVYHSRGAAARIVVCPLADDSLVAALSRRGYLLKEFEQVMVRELTTVPTTKGSPEIEIVTLGATEGARYATTVGPNFTEDGIVTPDLLDMMMALERMSCATAVIARCEGVDAGGGVLVMHEGLAMLAGAATLPPYRNRGVHSALFDARLRLAQEAGCDLAVMGARPGSTSQKNAERKGFQVAYTKLVVEREVPKE